LNQNILSHEENAMSDDEVKMLELDLKRADLRVKKTEVIAKYVSLLVLLIGIAIPFYQYVNTLKREQQEREDKRANEIAQRNKEIEAALREARKPFLERQQALYFEATSAASKLATLDGGTERDIARKRFYHLFWGELSVVEDELVESAMVRFKNTLDSYERGQVERWELEQMSLNLAHSCRDSLARGWGYERK
jgi:hypothetical protein